MEEEYAADLHERRAVKVAMRARLHNPCIRCMEYDFCQSALPCKRRELYLQKRRQIRAHMEEIMERARRERDNVRRQLSQKD